MASGIFFVLREPLSSSSLLRFPEPQAPSPPPLRRSSSPLPAAAAPPLSSSPAHRDGVRAPRRAPAAEQHELRRRHGYNAIDTEDGYKIRICHLLNIPRTRDKTLRQQNEQSQSASTTNTPRHPIEYWMGKFLSDDGTNPMRYALEENDFLRRVYQQYGCTMAQSQTSFSEHTNTLFSMAKDLSQEFGAHIAVVTFSPTSKPKAYGAPTGDSVLSTYLLEIHSSPSPASSETAGEAAARVDGMKWEAKETAFLAEAERMQGNRGWIITPPNSISVNQSTCSFCPNSKVDDNIPAASKIMSVEKESYRRVGCGQAKEDANIQHENMQSCSSEHSSKHVNSITCLIR
ncbi:uncharacterized protein LOC111257632 [Setaria italica]|uniref:uncharacterized protein LOC111257632 n=1 Tax=Setaria italica TaxID=4555 RepID=UPI000BE57763|nr:uncharacterized protein LOC111257632 [Setaria italica]